MPLIPHSGFSLAAGLVISAVVVAALVLGRELFLPMALATILAFILSPIIAWLVNRRIPRSAAVTAVIVTMVAVVAISSFAFSRQLLSLTAGLTTYQENIIRKVRSVMVSGASDSVIQKAANSISSIEAGVKKELRTAGEQSPTTPVSAPAKPAGATVLGQIHSLTSPLGQTGLTVLLTLFLLLGSHDMRDRVVRLVGTDHISTTTAALTDAGERLSRVFLIQAALNSSFGILIALALWILGVPDAMLWGIVAFLMRFIPFIGSILATIPPTLIALAVDPGWGMALGTLVVFVVGEVLLGNVIEPLVLGKSAGLSPLAMVLSAGFWATVWGPIGLILAAPITLSLVVLGQYFPRLEFLSVLLGDQPALTPQQEFYHRLLTDDALAAAEQIELAIAASTATEVADRIVLPALKLAARDQRIGRLDAGRIAYVEQAMADVQATLRQAPAQVPGIDREAAAQRTLDVLVIPARGPVDAIAASFIASVIDRAAAKACAAIVTSSGLLALSSARNEPATCIPTTILIVTVGGLQGAHLKFLAARAARDFPGARLLMYAIGTIQDPKTDANGVAAAPILPSLGGVLGMLGSPATDAGSHQGHDADPTSSPLPSARVALAAPLHQVIEGVHQQ